MPYGTAWERLSCHPDASTASLSLREGLQEGRRVTEVGVRVEKDYASGADAEERHRLAEHFGWGGQAGMQMQMEGVERVASNRTLSSLLCPGHSMYLPLAGDVPFACHLHTISPTHQLLSRRHCQTTQSFTLQCLVSLWVPEKPRLLCEQRLNPGLLSWLGSVGS